MGYYTRYYLQVVNIDPTVVWHDPLVFLNNLKLDKGYAKWYRQKQHDDIRMVMNEGEPTSQWNAEHELLLVSRLHPKLVFILDGEGEEPSDVWREFYLNGRFHTWKLVVSPPELTETILDKLRS